MTELHRIELHIVIGQPGIERLIVEPWPDEYQVRLGQRARLKFESPDPTGFPEVVLYEREIYVYAPSRSTYTIDFVDSEY